MANNFIDSVNEYNSYLVKTSQGIGSKYDINYTLDDLKKIGSKTDKDGNTKADPDIKFLKGYDFALAMKRASDQSKKTPQDWYSAYNQEVKERIDINNQTTQEYLKARKF